MRSTFLELLIFDLGVMISSAKRVLCFSFACAFANETPVEKQLLVGARAFFAAVCVALMIHQILGVCSAHSSGNKCVPGKVDNDNEVGKTLSMTLRSGALTVLPGNSSSERAKSTFEWLVRFGLEIEHLAVS